MIFRLKKEQFKIRTLSAPGVVWLVCPMTATREREIERGFEEFDTKTRQMRTTDFVGVIKAKAVEVIRGWTGMPGEDGEIEYSTDNLMALCDMHLDVISEVLAESKRADAVRVEESAKNS